MGKKERGREEGRGEGRKGKGVKREMEEGKEKANKLKKRRVRMEIKFMQLYTRLSCILYKFA